MKYDISKISGRNIASRELSCELGKLNGFLLKLGEDARLGKGGHMENHEHTPKFELD